MEGKCSENDYIFLSEGAVLSKGERIRTFVSAIACLGLGMHGWAGRGGLAGWCGGSVVGGWV